jgi:hypothetical protein
VGGRRGLVVRLNAGMNGPIVFERVDVLESVRMGVLVDGDATVAHLLDVRVEGVEQEDGQFGWGIGIQTSASFLSELAEPNVLQDVVVTDVQGLGILGDGGWVEILDTEVSDVAKVDDTLGRGIQLQQWTRGTLDGVSVFDVNDASVFLESPGRIVDPVEVYDCLLGPTAEATVPEGGGESAADGLVATQAIDVPSSAADFQVIVDGTELDGNPRVHLLAEAITLSVGTNNIFGDGTGFPVVSQGSAAVQGIDGGEPGHPAEELGAEDALQLNKELVQMDQLGSD